jgi:tRNA G37 N-methylase Trm5
MPINTRPQSGKLRELLFFAVILKPSRRLDVASIMRHLSVPSAQTQTWLDFCKSNGWLFSEAGVHPLDGGRKGIPLLDNAPIAGDSVWQGMPEVMVDGRVKGPSHWTQRLDEEIFKKMEGEWPSAFEVQGDLQIVKIEPELQQFESNIAAAMLHQSPNIRVICADEGVQGDFRIRKLRVLQSRDGNESTLTRIKENGYSLWVDPTKVYFSIRLSTQRINTVTSAKNLSQRLGRGIVVCDPYAGVGPSMGALLAEDGLVSGYHVGDLNPQAVELLQMNIEHLVSKSSGSNFSPATIRCADATKWAMDDGLVESCDLLLVNLPHDSISHLPKLIPLLKKGDTTVLRGWAIIDKDEFESQKQLIIEVIEKTSTIIESVTIEEIKGFSSSKCFACFEVWLSRPI